MRPFDANGGRSFALAVLLGSAPAAATACSTQSRGGAGDAGRGGASSTAGGATSASNGAGGGGAAASSSAASGGGGGSEPCHPATAAGGAELDCGSLPSTGGKTVWTAAVPAPAISSPLEQPGMWSLRGIFAGTTGHAFVAVPYANPGWFGAPAGVALHELDAAGNVLGDLGPSDTAVSFTLRGLGVYGARHYVVGVTFAEWTTYRLERLASDTAFVASERDLLDSGELFATTGDDAGDTFAAIGVGDNPDPDEVEWGMCWGLEQGNFLAKWGAAGDHAWTTPLPAYGAFPTSFEPDGLGGIYLAGALSGPLDLGCAPASSGSGYLARLGADGACVYSRAIDAGSGALRMVHEGATGDLYLYNTFDGTIDLGCGPMTSGAGTTAYAARLDPTGQCVYSVSLDVDSLDVALFPSGDLLLSAAASGPVELGGATLAPLGTEDAVVARLDAAGQPLWSRRFGAPGATVSCAGALADPKGSVVLPCAYVGAVDFGGGPLPGGGVVKLDGDGAFVWQRGPAVGSVAADPCGAVITASTCASCASSATPGVLVTKLAP